jgi:hypothetical protein
VRCFRWNDLSVELEVSSAITFSLAHCGVLPISDISATNQDSRPSREGRLDISIVGCGLTESMIVPALNPSERRDLPIPQFRFNYEALEGQTERVRRLVRVELNGQPSQGNPLECWVLPFNEWSLTPGHRLSLGAFVFPNHPLVVQLEHDACQQLPLSSSSAAVLEAVYAHLSSLWKLTYRHEVHSLDDSSQRIRLPHQILLDSQRKLGQGTCIDIALLISGSMESRGMQPLVAILDVPNGKHALVGCWTRPKAGLEPLVFDKQRLESGAVWIDPNGITKDGDRRLSFKDSCEVASRYLADNPLVFALDISAARRDGIMPMPFAGKPHWSEVASEILEAAQKIAETVPTRLATVPLLVALLTPENGLARLVIAARFEDVDGIRNKLLMSLPKQIDSQKASGNYVRVLDLAKSDAKADGSPLVLERHLLRALLSIEGTALDNALVSFGTNRLELRSVLHNITSGRERQTSYSAFSEFPSYSG